MLKRTVIATLLLVGARAWGQTVNIQVTASPAQTLTDAYFLIGSEYFVYPIGGGFSYQAMPLGTLPAATASNPDVLNLSFSSPLLQWNIGGQTYTSNAGSWMVVGLYAPGSVSVSISDFSSVSGSWSQVFPDSSIFGSEATIATALAAGDIGTLSTFLSYGAPAPSDLGGPATFYNFSNATPSGSVTAVAVPEPSLLPWIGILMIGLLCCRLRRCNRA
jgi:hypothetical protein